MFCLLRFSISISAQTDTTRPLVAADTTRPLKIAVFAPVYLDSVFTDADYKLGRNNLPKYLLPGLDFYNGIMRAIDSLNKENTPVEVLFYDSKSSTEPIEDVLLKYEMNDVSLIIASFNTRTDVKPLADFALSHNIPLISSVYPNDGGVTANPYFVLINPTLGTHIEAIYKYLQRYYPTDNITMFSRKGGAEDMIQAMISDMNKKTYGIPLKLKTIELSDNFTSTQLATYLDSTKKNVMLCGSLNETFGTNLVKAIGSLKSYQAVIMGMPTWDGIKDLGKETDIIYSTPYNLLRTDKLSQQLTAKYRARYFSRPSDMVFKGFESMYHFTKLLLKHRNELINNLSDKQYTLFNEFDIQPVKANKESTAPDYLENKKIYFVRKLNTKFKSMN